MYDVEFGERTDALLNKSKKRIVKTVIPTSHGATSPFPKLKTKSMFHRPSTVPRLILEETAVISLSSSTIYGSDADRISTTVKKSTGFGSVKKKSQTSKGRDNESIECRRKSLRTPEAKTTLLELVTLRLCLF